MIEVERDLPSVRISESLGEVVVREIVPGTILKEKEVRGMEIGYLDEIK